MRALFLYFYHLLAPKKRQENLLEANADGDARHSRYRKDFLHSLSKRQRRRRQRRIPREALLTIDVSPWRKLLNSRHDGALITATGFDMSSLSSIFARFAPLFDNNSPFVSDCISPINPKRGRKRKIRHEDCVGLTLMWTRTRGAVTLLQMIFGMTRTNFDLYLKFGIRIMIELYARHPLAKLGLPTAEKVAEYKEAVAARHPHLQDVCFTMDGLKLYIEKPSDEKTQSRFYNGWTHGHYVTSVFVFAPDGTIVFAFYNLPGCIHDSQTAHMGEIYKKLALVYELYGGKCTVDDAFAKVSREYLIKSSQDKNYSNAETRAEQIADIAQKRDATSMRQSAEWGMRLLQASIPRLKDTIRFEDRGDRGLMLKLAVLLVNLRSRMVGINQIRNVYMPALKRSVDEVVNVDG